MTNLVDLSSHFDFGRNWRSYVDLVTHAEVDRATLALSLLLTRESLQDRSFLDIFCGSGLHALAAVRLGAKSVVAIDLDPNSIEAARALLHRFAPEHNVDLWVASVLDLGTGNTAQQHFDIVYSWGVLHHTGCMVEAISCATKAVRPDGLFALALYRRTAFCEFWKSEKRWYRDSSEPNKARARGIYSMAMRGASLVSGQRFSSYVQAYPEHDRGMDFLHDVHDWLGGYPCESISPSGVHELMTTAGLSLVDRRLRVGVAAASGVLGSGCNEYLYRHDLASS